MLPLKISLFNILFNSKNFKDYDHDKMLKHIVFDLCRIIGDAGFRLYELLTDYVDDVYNRNEIRTMR